MSGIGDGHGAEVAGEIDGGHQNRVNLVPLEHPEADGQSPEPAGRSFGDPEARTAKPEFPSHPAGHDPAQGAHGPGGGQGRTTGILERLAPGIGVLRRHKPGGPPFPNLPVEPPAKMKVGGLVVKVDPDHRPHPRPLLPERHPGVGQGIGGHPER